MLVLGTLGLLFVGLMAVAGFTVMAQRRLRALGMLGSLGATDATSGWSCWPTAPPSAPPPPSSAPPSGWPAGSRSCRRCSRSPSTASTVSPCRGGRSPRPWSWPSSPRSWPPGGRHATVARIPIVAALSGRPPRPQPAHRFAALGGVLLGAGIVLLAFADQHRSRLHHRRHRRHRRSGSFSWPRWPSGRSPPPPRRATDLGQAGPARPGQIPGPLRCGPGRRHPRHRHRRHHRHQRVRGPDATMSPATFRPIS